MVADACQTMLRDSNALREFAEQKPEAAKGIIQWLADWFKKIKAAFSRSAQLSDQARFMEKLEKDVREAFGKLWDDALREAVRVHDEIGNMESPATEGGEQYSIRPDIRDELTVIKELKRPFGDELLLGSTSDFLVNEIGYEQQPFYMAESKLYRVMVSEEQARRDKKFRKKYKGSYHNLGVDTTAQILEQSETPLAAFQDTPENGEKRTDRIVLVTNVEADGGLGVVVVEPGRTANLNGQRIPANKAVTVFGKTLAKQHVRSAFNQGRLLYIDKNNGHIFNSGGKGANYPTAISEDAHKNNIQHYWADVNWVNENVGQKTFGDNSPNTPMAEALKNWNPHSDRDYLSAVESGDMETAQKMVDEAANAAGYTIKAYHGTGSLFNVFDLQKSGSNSKELVGDAAEGMFFFASIRSAYPGSAQDYARMAGKKTGKERIQDVYLKITNPLVLDSKGWYATADYYDNNKESIYDQYISGDYDGIIIRDSSGGDDNTIYLLDDANRIKSADPVTYDDQGNVIPLSERFNPEQEDIRYSERDYSTPFDLELMEQAAEEWYEARWNELLKDEAGDTRTRLETAAKSERKLRDLQRKFEKLQATFRASRAKARAGSP